MAKLVYTAIASLDGYIEDENGDFGWAAPDEEVHAFANELERSVGTQLYGRRMYETMAAWETEPALAASSDVTAEFARLWQEDDKVVYSRSLEEAITSRTRIEREFDPEAVEQMKSSATKDLSIGGPGLAAQALEAGLIDECHLITAPVVVGGGKRWLPDGLRTKLELLDERRFASGFVHLHYRLEQSPGVS
jgi:dihydrofolate reductase